MEGQAFPDDSEETASSMPAGGNNTKGKETSLVCAAPSPLFYETSSQRQDLKKVTGSVTHLPIISSSQPLSFYQ